MPEFDGVTIIAFASFAMLVLAWLLAPAEATSHVHVATKTLAREAVAA